MTPVFASRSVTVKKIHAGASGPFFGGSAGFSSSNKYGAILATPDPIHCHDAPHIIGYKEYAKENIESWLQCARRNGHDIKLEDLILVTGVDRTTSWATAVFSDTGLDADFGLDAQFIGGGIGVQLACQLSWQNTTGAWVNSGPAITQTRRTSASRELSTSHSSTDGEAAAASNAECRPINVDSNQSVFIRHLRAKRRLPWSGLKLEANGESGDGSADDKDKGNESTDVTADDDLVVVSSSNHEQFTDSLEPVLDYILQYSDAKIAIAHDEDLEYLPATTSPSSPDLIIHKGVGLFPSERRVHSMQSDQVDLGQPQQQSLAPAPPLPALSAAPATELDLNDPTTLEIYSRILLFKDDMMRDELAFSRALSSKQRRIVHLVAQKLGMHHYSVGEGEDRYAVVTRIDLEKRAQAQGYPGTIPTTSAPYVSATSTSAAQMLRKGKAAKPNLKAHQAQHPTKPSTPRLNTRLSNANVREGYNTIASPPRRAPTNFPGLFLPGKGSGAPHEPVLSAAKSSPDTGPESLGIRRQPRGPAAGSGFGTRRDSVIASESQSPSHGAEEPSHEPLDL
ncbi:hypothetical protein PENSPDRAFT_265816 [Peniophora sp. CONT]|nr:hypothetical protein PENSPDRAFT_265816 [Peniophora sp. CONT]